MNSIIRFFKVDPREIGFIRFVVEACDGVAVLRTVDPRAGLVAFHIAPGFEDELTAVLADIPMTRLEESEMDDAAGAYAESFL